MRLGIIFNANEVNTKDFREMLRCELSKYNHLFIKYFAISYEYTLEENLNALYTQYYRAITFDELSDCENFIFLGKQFKTPSQYPYKEMVKLAKAKDSSYTEIPQDIVDIIANTWRYMAHYIPYPNTRADLVSTRQKGENTWNNHTDQ